MCASTKWICSCITKPWSWKINIAVCWAWIKAGPTNSTRCASFLKVSVSEGLIGPHALQQVAELFGNLALEAGLLPWTVEGMRAARVRSEGFIHEVKNGGEGQSWHLRRYLLFETRDGSRPLPPSLNCRRKMSSTQWSWKGIAWADARTPHVPRDVCIYIYMYIYIHYIQYNMTLTIRLIYNLDDTLIV